MVHFLELLQVKPFLFIFKSAACTSVNASLSCCLLNVRVIEFVLFVDNRRIAQTKAGSSCGE